MKSGIKDKSSKTLKLLFDHVFKEQCIKH